MAYGENLANEIESLVLRQDYSECRYRGLLELVNDCENNLNSLNSHGNRCTKERNALKRLLEPNESNPSKRMRKSAEQGELTNQIDHFLVHFHSNALHFLKMAVQVLCVHSVRIALKIKIIRPYPAMTLLII